MSKMSPEEILAFLEEPHIAHLVTLRPDGSPHAAPVWYEYRDGCYSVFTWTPARKVKHLRNDRRDQPGRAQLGGCGAFCR